MIKRTFELRLRRVLATLNGKLPTHELTDAEDAVWLATFAERMGEGTKAEDEFYARLGDRGADGAKRK
jgi:hypothetical protein